jgi:ABC-type sugar transport system ATPase subunit
VAAISLESLGKVFARGQPAVRDVSLAIEDGELMVLVGPSGSGKSTLLRLIAGLEQPTAGRVRIGGHDVTGLPPQARDLAMVFQSYALYPHMTVRENLSFGLRVRGVAAGDIAGRVAKIADLLGLAALLDRRPSQLSGGQRQRVALGRAIVREPQAFLFDEPLSNLDPSLRLDTRAQLSSLHRRLRATMVYVTHDQEEAMTLGTRIAVMRDGALVQVDAPMAVYDRPSDTFVARFVGSPSMNLLDPSEVPAAGTLAPPPGAIVGIRPQDLVLVAADAAEADARGRVETVEPLGSTTIVHIVLNDADRSVVKAVVPGDVRTAVDDTVGVRFRRDRLHFFDRASGRRSL